ncbi:MAG: energy transducer TonB [Treponema sp.]|jgi:protein TonB|nr:energy transducer TonB [Treponema sp.]
MKNHNRLGLLLFAAVALLHGVLIFTVAFTAKSPPPPPREARVMKLAGVEEEEEQEEERPPEEPEEFPLITDETAETMIETEEVPQAAPRTASPARSGPEPAGEQYLPMHQVSVPPVFDSGLITGLLPYPPIALRSNVEGRVILELFIDRTGLVRNITVMRETPPGYGFGEAAVRAFTGLRCVPAEANGGPVSVRYRYPVTFRISR